MIPLGLERNEHVHGGPTEHLEEFSGWITRCVTSYEVGESFHVLQVTADQPGQNIPSKGVLWLLSREIISLKM